MPAPSMTIASGGDRDVGADRVDEPVAKHDRARGDWRTTRGDQPGTTDGVDLRRLGARRDRERQCAGDDARA